MSEILTISRAARLLEVSESTVRRWIREGKVKCYETERGNKGVMVKDLIRRPRADDPLLQQDPEGKD